MRYLAGGNIRAKEVDVGGAEVGRDGGADDADFAVEPTDAGAPAEGLQPQKGADGQADVAALDAPQPRLAALHPAVLLDPLVVLLDPPGVVLPLLPLQG